MVFPEVYVSPDGAAMEVASPAVAVRMRARGWLPESEVVAEPDEPAPPQPVKPARPHRRPEPALAPEQPAQSDEPKPDES